VIDRTVGAVIVGLVVFGVIFVAYLVVTYLPPELQVAAAIATTIAAVAWLLDFANSRRTSG